MKYLKFAPTNPLYFFTGIPNRGDIFEVSNYCLLNIKDYGVKDIHKLKKVIYIDPGVYELKSFDEYSKIGLLHELLNFVNYLL